MAPKTAPSSSTAATALSPKASVAEITQHIWQRYLAQTSQRTFLLDAFMAYLVLVGGIQFVYCVIAGNYVRRHTYL
jgi:oligosaccharyltransferase complex subunit epsilon